MISSTPFTDQEPGLFSRGELCTKSRNDSFQQKELVCRLGVWKAQHTKYEAAPPPRNLGSASAYSRKLPSTKKLMTSPFHYVPTHILCQIYKTISYFVFLNVVISILYEQVSVSGTLACHKLQHLEQEFCMKSTLSLTAGGCGGFTQYRGMPTTVGTGRNPTD